MYMYIPAATTGSFITSQVMGHLYTSLPAWHYQKREIADKAYNISTNYT